MVIANEQMLVDLVLPNLKAANRKQIFQTLAQKAALATGLGCHDLMAALWDTEQRTSSGIGDGVAIPHLRVRGLREPFTLFARLSHLVDFDAPDGDPVDMVFLILSPQKEDQAFHLRRLAHISRLLRHEDMRRRLHGSHDAEALQVMFYDPEQIMIAA
ncbi:MAG: PTS sugar transporter subunit IIA [Rhodospirillales bacterium]|nr:PTS sugar transporter subunit IIA [Rhodospirillales bacterium]